MRVEVIIRELALARYFEDQYRDIYCISLVNRTVTHMSNVPIPYLVDCSDSFFIEAFEEEGET